MRSWRTTIGVSVGAMVLASVGIQASDVFTNVNGNLLSALVGTSGVGGCAAGTVSMQLGNGVLCVDTFEAAPAEVCPVQNVTAPIQSTENLADTECLPTSEEGLVPWRYVSFVQAQQLCARAGKRLPTNEEWYAVALGTTDQTTCNVASASVGQTGAGCRTTAGVYDVVGNVWEWIDGEVINGVLNGKTLPESGYVSLTDRHGIVLETAAVPAADYQADYAKTDSSGVYGIIRGGFFAGGADSGMYAQNLAVPLDLKTAGVGFRCVYNL